MDVFVTYLMKKMTLEEKIGQLNLVANWTYISNATLSSEATNTPSHKVSQMLNFPSQSQFGRYFKKFTGYSPRQYQGL